MEEIVSGKDLRNAIENLLQNKPPLQIQKPSEVLVVELSGGYFY